MTGPADPEAATFEARVIDYVWRSWRETQSGASEELEGVVIKTVAVVCEGDRVSARVEWVSPRETGQPIHVTERAITADATYGPDQVGDDIVWAIWAEAHGTS